MSAADPDRFKRLPEPIRLEDTVETHDVEPLRAEKSIDEIERAQMLRYAGS
jgi:hypothetical protein